MFLQVIKYSISVPLDRAGFGGWNLMLTDVETPEYYGGKCRVKHLKELFQQLYPREF